MKPKTKKGCLIALIIAIFIFVIIPLIINKCSDGIATEQTGSTTEQSIEKTQKEKNKKEKQSKQKSDVAIEKENKQTETKKNEKISFERFAYYKRDKSGDFNYRIFVYITNAASQQMEQHAKKQMWSSHGTTMVCYFSSSDGLNSDAISLAKDVDAAIDAVWKPSLLARYMHWPTGKEDFQENPYSE